MLMAELIVVALDNPFSGGSLWQTAAEAVTWSSAPKVVYASGRRKGGGKVVPGPRFPLPVLGGLVPMVMDPYKFWEDQRKYVKPSQ